jgi:hypothetical protein
MLVGVVVALLLTGCVPATERLGAANPAAVPGAASAQVRNYYIAADEVLWNYAPHNRNDITGTAFGDTENVFVQRGPTRIGHVYRKSLYRGYTDATFSKRTTTPTACAVSPRAPRTPTAPAGPRRMTTR